jgi:hypothetical protein
MTTTTAYTNVNLSNINNFTDILNYANSTANDYLFTAITFLVFIVITISLSGNFGWEAGILVSAFIGLILSILFLYMGLVAWYIVGFFIAVILITIILIILGNKYD